jgi:hypothetical protein
VVHAGLLIHRLALFADMIISVEESPVPVTES